MNWYAKVIDVLNIEQDWKSVVFKIAKEHPKSVFMACDLKESQDWWKDVKQLIINDRFIDAVKLYRSKTGLSLKESKYACDQIKAERI